MHRRLAGLLLTLGVLCHHNLLPNAQKKLSNSNSRGAATDRPCHFDRYRGFLLWGVLGWALCLAREAASRAFGSAEASRGSDFKHCVHTRSRGNTYKTGWMDPPLGIEHGFRLSERHPRGVTERLAAPGMVCLV